MAAVYVEKTFLLEALRSGEFNCMAVCMYEGKGTYLGTRLFVNMFLLLSNDENNSCYGTSAEHSQETSLK